MNKKAAKDLEHGDRVHAERATLTVEKVSKGHIREDGTKASVLVDWREGGFSQLAVNQRVELVT